MPKILLIDDDQPVRSGIRDLLEVKGYTVIAVDNGRDGVSLAEDVAPDLVLCDIMMPGMDGYEVLRELRAQPTTALTPFIFLTSKSEMSDLRQGMRQGADDYLVKPFLASDLYESISTRLEKQRLLTQQLKGKKSSVPEKQGAARSSSADHVFIMDGDQGQFVKISSIECITAFSEYTNVYVDTGAKYVVRKFLKEWESYLPKKTFLRIHRSTIINLDFVERIEKFFERSYIVHLRNIKQPFTISQRYATRLRAKNLF